MLTAELRQSLGHLSPQARQWLHEHLGQERGLAWAQEEAWAWDYERRPVPVRQFIEDAYYLGAYTAELSGTWKGELETVLEEGSRVVEWILKGAIGTGKTTASAIAQLYKIYRLSCLRDPAAFYGLLPGSEIVWGYFNITLDRAETGFDHLKGWVDGSPYFKEHCPRRPRTGSKLIFPAKNITVHVGSLAGHVLGDNLFGFVLDEANFFKPKRSLSAAAGDQTRAHDLYRQAKSRMTSRFMRRGRLPCLLTLISSEETKTAFLEKHEQAHRSRPETHVTSFSLWEARDRGRFSAETFLVVVGDETRQSVVLEPGEIPPRGLRVVEVPEDLRGDFEEDPDLALMDLAGVATAGHVLLFPDARVLERGLDSRVPCPARVQAISYLGAGSGRTIDEALDEDVLFVTRRSSRVPRHYPGQARRMHIDIGLTRDALGLALGHPVETAAGTGVRLDLMLRVKAPPGEEVDLTAVVEFAHWLQERGMGIASVTYDQFQSSHSIQLLQGAGIDAGRLSVGMDQYLVLRKAVQDGRMRYYRYGPFLEEAAALLKDAAAGKVDHPAHGSKDVSDAVAAVTALCLDGVDLSIRRGRRAELYERHRGVIVRGAPRG